MNNHDKQLVNKRFQLDYHKLLKFIILFLCLFFFLNAINLYFFSASSPQGKYYNEFFAKHFNYIQWIRSSLIFFSSEILKVVGIKTISNAYQMISFSGTVVNVNYSCIGLQLFSFFTAFAVSFPLKKRLNFLLIGFLIIYLLNIFRITIIIFIIHYFPLQREYMDLHHEIYNIFIYICLFILMYGWLKMSSSNT